MQNNNPLPPATPISEALQRWLDGDDPPPDDEEDDEEDEEQQ